MELILLKKFINVIMVVYQMKGGKALIRVVGVIRKGKLIKVKGQIKPN